MPSFVYMNGDTPTVARGVRVIKAADYQALLDAKALLDAARDRAAATLAEAGLRATEIADKAKGFCEAEKARGYAEGKLKADDEAVERRMELAFATTDYFESLEESVVELVMTGVRKVLGSFDNRTLAVQVVSSALAVMRSQKLVTLRICAAEAEIVRERLDTILSLYPGIGFVEVVADGRLLLGGCILESELGIVDASLETQLGRLEAALSKRLGDGKIGRLGSVPPP
ncbi:MAG: HrpE/YscL family type III secretion apparatus protein [Rhodospirillaceae bacterium]